MTEPAFDQLLRRLSEAGVEFVLVGGLAVNAWGAERAASDLLVAETLGPCSDIDDAVIGFYAQQMVEKSLKVALALGDVGFRMMEHDLDFLLTLAANGDTAFIGSR